MLDEPSLSRQWVARRLQRALSVERWCGPLREGFGRSPSNTGNILRTHGGRAAERALRLEALIREMGGEPYGSSGLGAKMARFGGRLVPLLSLRLTRHAAMLIAEHTLSEYEALDAIVQAAAGIDSTVSEAIEPLGAQVASEFEELGSSRYDRS